MSGQAEAVARRLGAPMTPIGRTAELNAAVKRAREAARAAGEFDLPTGPFESHWVPELRHAVVALHDDGTYDDIVRSIAASDRDLA
jgi:hypothetical protein